MTTGRRDEPFPREPQRGGEHPSENARWAALSARLPADLSARRVLTLGTSAKQDAVRLAQRGAEVTVCAAATDPQDGWRTLEPGTHGSFDLVHCNGLLEHERQPLLLLERLRALLADNGELWLGAFILARVELSEYTRFVAAAFAEDPSWWWVPGRLALRWMLDSVGLAVKESFDLGPGPEGDFPVVHSYVRACLPAHPGHPGGEDAKRPRMNCDADEPATFGPPPEG